MTKQGDTMHRTAIATYIASLVAANLLVARYGPSVTVINAFTLIGLDFVLRDYLHDRWTTRRAPKMVALIATAGIVSYLLNPATGIIALASVTAITAASLVDWATYHAASRYHWLARSNASNTAAAATDSIIFPTIAFGALIPEIILAQFAAKTLGGLVWSFAILGARNATTHNNRPSHDAQMETR